MSFEFSEGTSPAELPCSGTQNINQNNDSKIAQFKNQSSKQSMPGETEIIRLQRENKALKKMISELQQNRENSNGNDNNLDPDNLFGQFTELKKQYKILKKKESESSSRAAKLEYDLQEIRLEKNDYQNEVEKLKIEINQLQLKQSDNIENDNDNNDTEQALKLIGDIVEAETKELSEISAQRTEFIKIVHSLEQSNSEYDKLLEEANAIIEDQKGKLKSLQNKLDESSKENEKQMNDALLGIIKLSPVEYQEVIEKLNENTSNKDKIIALFSYEKEKVKQMPTEKVNQQANDPMLTTLSNREASILAHLQNAVQFIKVISESATTPPTENDKEYCLNQIQAIQKFIDSQGQVVEITSLYENEDPEDQLQTFFSFCEQNDIQRSPMYELFTLFKGTLGLNKILFENLDSTANKSQNNEKKLAKLAKDSKHIASKYDQLRDKLNETSEKLCQCVDKPSSDCFEMIDQLIEEKNEIQSQNSKLDREVHAEKQALKHNKKKCENEEKKMKSKNDKEVKKLVDSYRTRMNEQAQELNHVKAQLEQSNQTILKLKHRIQKVTNEKDEIQNDAANEIQSVMQQNADLTNQITELRDKQSQSESLSMILDAKHRAHSDEVSALKHQIAIIEDRNAQTLCELREKNASLSRKYEAQIKTLNSDLNETRKMLQDAQNGMSTLEKTKTSLQLQIAKLKLSDRTKELKYQQMAEYFNNKSQSDEASSTAKLLAQKSQYESLINDKNDEICLCSQLLRNSLEEDFQITTEAETPLYDLTTAITTAIKEKVTPQNAELIDDAYKIQSIYGNDSQSLLDCFNSLRKESDEIKSKVEEQELVIQNLTKDLESSRIEAARCNQSRQDLKSWDKWGMSMYKRVAKSSTQRVSASDIQSILGNIIINYEDSKCLHRKIDMLSAEKTILLATKCGKSFKKPSSERLHSIKPLIWSLALASRFLNKMKDEQKNENDDNECDISISTEKRKSTPIIPLSK